MGTAEHDEQPVQVILADLDGEQAHGWITEDGQRVCIIDSAFRDNDPATRAGAYNVFLAQAATQAARDDHPREHPPRRHKAPTAADRCASWPRPATA